MANNDVTGSLSERWGIVNNESFHFVFGSLRNITCLSCTILSAHVIQGIHNSNTDNV